MIDNNNFSVNMPRRTHSIIMVLGVGGAGGNAVNHMFDLGIKGVTFMLCNTDRQALMKSPVELQVQLGEGLGAGNDPVKGRNAAIESLDQIMLRLEEEQTKMVFITAGMGGGTGTGAAPVIAKAAHQKGLLTVGIVTLPFKTEGKKRVDQAAVGLEELRRNVDSLVVIHNDNLSKMYGSLPFEEAFCKADDILATAARGISELITRHSLVNVDFADVSAVMRDSGMALMGSARAEGANKIDVVVDNALSSPLLNQQDIRGAKDILFNITYGTSLTMDDATHTLELIQQRASRGVRGNEANIIWGAGSDPLLGEQIELTVIATGFDSLTGNIPSVESLPEQKEESADDVLTVAEKNIYDKIDELWRVPSYVKKGVSLSASKGRASEVVVGSQQSAQDQSQDDDTPKTGSLF